jgi:hypothetical protein
MDGICQANEDDTGQQTVNERFMIHRLASSFGGAFFKNPEIY